MMTKEGVAPKDAGASHQAGHQAHINMGHRQPTAATEHGEAHIDPKRRANYAALLLIRDTLVMVAQALVATAAAAHAKGHLKERPQASMRVSRSLIRCKLEGDAVTSLKHTASMPTN